MRMKTGGRQSMMSRESRESREGTRALDVEHVPAFGFLSEQDDKAPVETACRPNSGRCGKARTLKGQP